MSCRALRVLTFTMELVLTRSDVNRRRGWWHCGPRQGMSAMVNLDPHCWLGDDSCGHICWSKPYAQENWSWLFEQVFEEVCDQKPRINLLDIQEHWEFMRFCRSWTGVVPPHFQPPLATHRFQWGADFQPRFCVSPCQIWGKTSPLWMG